jgi:hypothetical protein
MKIEAIFCVFFLLLGRIVQVVQHTTEHVFQGTKIEEACNCTNLGTFFNAKNSGKDLVAVRYFFLAKSCEYAAVIHFPEAINKISLSLSLGFPTLGFSLAFD